MISYNDRSNCDAARLCFYDLLDAESETNVPEDVRRHIADCRHCQADMDRLEALLADTGKKNQSEQSRKDSAVATLLSLHFAWLDKAVTCQSAKPFLPSLADPRLRITIPTPITVHVDECRRCSDELSAIDSLGLTHKQLCRLGQTMAETPSEDETGRVVAEQADSGIATRFTFREPDDESVDTKSDRRYADWPISVQVLEQVSTRGGSTDDLVGNGKRALVVTLKRHAKPVKITAVAVILIGFALFLGTPTTKATDLDRIYSAVNEARNIHVSYFTPGVTEPEQESWVSRPLRMYVKRVGQEVTVYNLSAGSKMVRGSGRVASEAVSLTRGEAAEVRRAIDGALSIVPFNNVSEVPPDATWNRVADNALGSGDQVCKVYDLTWTVRIGANMALVRKWRVLVDAETNLPLKAQLYDKLPHNDQYVLKAEDRIEYLSDDAMKTAIEQASL